MIPSLQSTATWPVLKTDRKIEWSALATSKMAHFSSSARMSPGPAERPFFSLRKAAVTSSRDDSSTDVIGLQRHFLTCHQALMMLFPLGDSRLAQSIFTNVPRSVSVSQGKPSALCIEEHVGFELVPASCLMALKTDPVFF